MNENIRYLQSEINNIDEQSAMKLMELEEMDEKRKTVPDTKTWSGYFFYALIKIEGLISLFRIVKYNVSFLRNLLYYITFGSYKPDNDMVTSIVKNTFWLSCEYFKLNPDLVLWLLLAFLIFNWLRGVMNDFAKYYPMMPNRYSANKVVIFLLLIFNLLFLGKVFSMPKILTAEKSEFLLGEFGNIDYPLLYKKVNVVGWLAQFPIIAAMIYQKEVLLLLRSFKKTSFRGLLSRARCCVSSYLNNNLLRFIKLLAFFFTFLLVFYNKVKGVVSVMQILFAVMILYHVYLRLKKISFRGAFKTFKSEVLRKQIFK